ncbi:MAG: hypothetical protein DSM107014_05030 [Gomphosphaeria aponina SAG 52.96 = DSM 107014]|uniref:Beta/gamma crystallin 'Greek key' domain-containing protein n=1 Tax=Gomphosphaeria aponina SAG 52.96 = DSM 107014 TaxID=1521640 RepID=A0A941GX72_9CHRO|nr:hypothetical protein [Gomphosphaeria aponina SAG 52.96 = DSM 107014]
MSGESVEVFTEKNFQGEKLGPVSASRMFVYQDQWNDKISSIKINSGTWRFFPDTDFRGSFLELDPGEYSELPDSATWDNKISSFAPVKPATRELIDWTDRTEYVIGASDTSVAVSNDDIVVSSVSDNYNVYYTIGKLNRDTKTIEGFDEAPSNFEIGEGQEPDVAISDDGRVVISMYEDEGNNLDLYYRVGIVNEAQTAIDWGDSYFYDTGDKPSIALSSDGKTAVAVAQWREKSKDDYGLYYSVGTVNETTKTIDWEDDQKFGRGIYPDIAMDDNWNVVLVDEGQTKDTIGDLYYQVGKVNPNQKFITWYEDTQYTKGYDPAIAMTDDGSEIIVGASETGNYFNKLEFPPVGTLVGTGGRLAASRSIQFLPTIYGSGDYFDDLDLTEDGRYAIGVVWLKENNNKYSVAYRIGENAKTDLSDFVNKYYDIAKELPTDYGATGGNKDLIIVGDSEEESYIFGGEGNDQISERDYDSNKLYYSFQTINDGESDDQMFGYDGDDYIDGGKGTDTINGGNGFDVIATGKIDGNNDVLRGDEEKGERYNDVFMIFAPDAETTSEAPGALEITEVVLDFAEVAAEVATEAIEEVSPYFAIAVKSVQAIIGLVNLFTGKGKEPTPPVWADMTVIQDFGVEDALVLGVGDFHSENQSVTYNDLGIYGVPATKFYDDTKSSERPQVLLENFQLESDEGWAVVKQAAGSNESDANFFQIYVKEGYENKIGQGSAQNSYIEGATVFRDENENGKLDKNEPSTKTDEDGYYDHSKLETDTKEGTIVSLGGKYILDNESYQLVLTAPKEFKHISPLSTLFTAISAEGITQEQLAEHFGIALHPNILDDDHIQSFISSYKTDDENSDLLEEKALINQEIGHLMAVGVEYLVKEGLAATVAEGGAMVIDALANIIKNAIEQDEPFSLRSEEDLEKVAIFIGLAPSEAPKVVEEYLAKDMELHMANILSTFDPENDEETEVIYGEDEGDEIKLDSSANQNQIVHGNGGNDVIDVTESQPEYNNTVKGDSGADQIIGGNADKLMGGTGKDTIDASRGGGSNKLYGQEGADVIVGGEGTEDTLDGGPGKDELYAGSGNTLTGNEDQDAFWLAIDKLPEEINTVTDWTPGEDVIGLKGIVINGRPLEFSDLVFTEVEGNTELGINDGEKVQPLATFLYISAEELNNPDNFVIPTPPMERIFGTTEADVIQVQNSQAQQLVFAGDGDDFVDATSANAAVPNIIYGGNGNDIITAGSKDILLGNEGNDAFYITNGGDNILTGGLGAEQFWLATAEYPAAMNQITDFEVGVDVLGIGGLGLEFADLTLTQADKNTIISIGSNGLKLASLVGIAPEQISADNFVFV